MATTEISTKNDHNQTLGSSSTATTTTTSSAKSIKYRILNISNELLKICKSDPNNSSLKSLPDSLPNQITSLKQLKSNLYVFFYENICSTELIDKKWPCKSQEDEIHNLQSVIDSLSLDVLHEDLSHLTAENILGAGMSIKPDLISIEYLLDILRCIHEWITSRTEPSINATQTNTNQPKEVEKNLILENKPQETVEIKEKEEETDIFKKYMKQKELEYNLNKTKRLVEDIENIKSSSGNSSASSSLVNLVNQEEQDEKHVKFKIDSRTRSNSPAAVFEIPKSRKIAKPSVHTVQNELEIIRNKLTNNLNLQTNKIDHLLKTLYSEDYKDAHALMHNSLKKIKSKSDLTNQLYLNAHNLDKNSKTMPKKNARLIASARSRSKGVLLPTSRSVSSLSLKAKRSSSMSSLNSSEDMLSDRWSSATRKSLALSKDPAKKFYSRFTIGEDGLLNCLLQEFPYLYTSPETIHYLWQRHSKHIETLNKAQKDLEQKYSNKKLNSLIEDSNSSNRVEQYLKETNQKQELLMEIMRKELEHLERVQNLKRKQLVENSMKAKTREQRFQNAKVKRYFEEFRLEQRAKMLKQKTSEELIFKKLFNESLKIQKERMLDLKKYAKEKNDINVKQQMNQIESIENFYKNKFELLSEQVKKEKEENQMRDSAQHLILTKMKNQAKNKYENDIRDLQDQMCRDKDFLHWRQMDADRLKVDIAKASYFKQATK